MTNHRKSGKFLCPAYLSSAYLRAGNRSFPQSQEKLKAHTG
ncbi:MAG: hypothetical protein R3C61_22545 [Bacteroidia bacterium]